MERAQAPHELGLWDSQIELGEKFFHEIIRHPVPLDLNILKALKRSSMGIDFYLWLTYRTFTLKCPIRLSWARLYRQFGADPAKADDKNTVEQLPYGLLARVEEDQDGLAGPELRYGPGSTDPLALQARCVRSCGFSSWS